MSSYDNIAACAIAYVKAQASEYIDDLSSVNAAIAARVALAQCLIDAGWTPPPEVAQALHRDRIVVRLNPGAVEGWSPDY